MASKFARDRGYEEELFEHRVSDNFKCSICLNVLKTPKSCGKNQHYFCLGCIGQHLENSHTCPECQEALTPETLVEPQRLLLNCISELRIKCGYCKRGCPEFVQLARLQNHEEECGYAPATCENEGCGTEINKKDKLLHETAFCKLRKVECHGCGELKKEIAKMKQDQEKTNKDMVMIMEEKQKEANEKQLELERKVALLVERMKNGVKGILDAEVERIFSDTQSDCRPPQDTKSEQHIVQRSRQPPINHDVIIIGGVDADRKITNCVEMFCCKEGRWTDLAPMIIPRSSASSVVIDNQIIVSGGNTPGERSSVPTDSIEVLNLDQRPLTWIMSDAKLPVPMSDHQTFAYKGKLIVFYFFFKFFPSSFGRYGRYDYSCKVFEVSLTSSYAAKELYALALSHGSESFRHYRAELINDNLFIFGVGLPQSSVVVYDLLANECRSMPTSAHPGWCKSTVVRGDQVILLEGVKPAKEDQLVPFEKKLKDVMMYDTETGGIEILPPVTRERNGSAAVLTDDVIMIMGGQDNYVEFYDFRTNTWQAFKAMKYVKSQLTAVVSP